jgi:hypothetical protein
LTDVGSALLGQVVPDVPSLVDLTPALRRVVVVELFVAPRSLIAEAHRHAVIGHEPGLVVRRSENRVELTVGDGHGVRTIEGRARLAEPNSLRVLSRAGDRRARRGGARGVQLAPVEEPVLSADNHFPERPLLRSTDARTSAWCETTRRPETGYRSMTSNSSPEPRSPLPGRFFRAIQRCTVPSLARALCQARVTWIPPRGTSSS